MFEPPRDSKKIENVLNAFEAYCNKKKNILYARYVFYKRYQKENESIKEFVSTCKTLIKDFEFGTKDEILRGKVILDTTDSDTRNKLIKKGDVSLDEAIKALRIAEIQFRDLKQMKLIDEARNSMEAFQSKKKVGVPRKHSNK